MLINVCHFHHLLLLLLHLTVSQILHFWPFLTILKHFITFHDFFMTLAWHLMTLPWLFIRFNDFPWHLMTLPWHSMTLHDVYDLSWLFMNFSWYFMKLPWHFMYFHDISWNYQYISCYHQRLDILIISWIVLIYTDTWILVLTSWISVSENFWIDPHWFAPILAYFLKVYIYQFCFMALVLIFRWFNVMQLQF